MELLNKSISTQQIGAILRAAACYRFAKNRSSGIVSKADLDLFRQSVKCSNK